MSDNSCSEELDNDEQDDESDDDTYNVSPPLPAKEDGIILEFASQPSGRHSTKDTVLNTCMAPLQTIADNILPELGSNSEVTRTELPPSQKAFTNIQSDDVIELSSEPPHTTSATRSLSAIRRKSAPQSITSPSASGIETAQPTTTTVHDIVELSSDSSSTKTMTRSLSTARRKTAGATIDVDDALKKETQSVIEAVQVENSKFQFKSKKQSVGLNATEMKHSDSNVDDSKMNGSKETAESTVTTDDGSSKVSKLQSFDHISTKASKPTEHLIHQRKSNLLPSLPFKPVMVNRYKSPSSQERKAPDKVVVSDLKSSVGTAAKNDDPLASESLTEHTLKIITEKVRKMDARYVQYWCNTFTCICMYQSL